LREERVRPRGRVWEEEKSDPQREKMCGEMKEMKDIACI